MRLILLVYMLALLVLCVFNLVYFFLKGAYRLIPDKTDESAGNK